METGRHRRSLTLRGLVTGLLVGILVAVAWASRSTVREAMHALAHAHLVPVAAALLCEVVMYGSLGGLLVRLFRPDVRLSWSIGAAIALVVYGLGGIMPASPAEGMTVATAELHRRGIRSGDAAKRLVLSEWERFVALAVLASVAAVAAVANGRSLRIGGATAISLAVGTVVVVALLATFVRLPMGGAWFRRLRRRSRSAGVPDDRRHPLPTAGHVLGPFRNRSVVVLLAAVGWLADVSCLVLCISAIGGGLGFDAVMLAYTLGAIASLIPLLPGGLGAVEVVVPTALHHFGLPLDLSLAATVAWRGLALFLPAASGLGAVVWLRRRVPEL